MLPRLEAEERRAAVSTIAVGTGSVKKADADRFMRDLERAAKGGEKGTRVQTIDDLRRLGLPVKLTPKRKAD